MSKLVLQGIWDKKSSLAYYLYWSEEDDSFAMREGVNKKVISLNEAESIYVDLKKNLEDMLVLADTNHIHLIEETREKLLELPISECTAKNIVSLFSR